MWQDAQGVDVKVHAGLPVDEVLMALDGVAFAGTRGQASDGQFGQPFEIAVGLFGAVEFGWP